MPFPIRALYDNVAGTSGVPKEFPYRTTLTLMTARELGTAILILTKMEMVLDQSNVPDLFRKPLIS